MSRPVSLAALAFACVLTSCSGASRAQSPVDQTTQFAPVTSPELPTTTTTLQASTTLRITTLPESVPSDGGQDDGVGDGGNGEDPDLDADLAEDPLDAAVLSMTSALGPTANIAQTLAEVLAFPVAISTPSDASVIEVNVGVGSLLPNSEGASSRSLKDVVVQVSATMETTARAENALQLLGSSLTRVGLQPTDSSTNDDATSRSFRIPGAGRFDEIVITAFDQPTGGDDPGGALVRVSYNGTASKVTAAPFQRWGADSGLLPASDQARTIVSVARSGEGRLATVTFRVESAAVVAGTRVQREADRLVRRIALAAEEDSATAPQFELVTPYDDEASAPLVDGLRSPGLDEAGYEVVPIQQIDIDQDGELELVDAIEVRLTGTRLIE